MDVYRLVIGTVIVFLLFLIHGLWYYNKYTLPQMEIDCARRSCPAPMTATLVHHYKSSLTCECVVVPR